jgi:hypothetical protein
MKVKINKTRLNDGVILGFQGCEFYLSISGYYVIHCTKSHKLFEFSNYDAARRFLTNFLKGV